MSCPLSKTVTTGIVLCQIVSPVSLLETLPVPGIPQIVNQHRCHSLTRSSATHSTVNPAFPHLTKTLHQTLHPFQRQIPLCQIPHWNCHLSYHKVPVHTPSNTMHTIAYCSEYRDYKLGFCCGAPRQICHNQDIHEPEFLCTICRSS